MSLVSKNINEHKNWRPKGLIYRRVSRRRGTRHVSSTMALNLTYARQQNWRQHINDDGAEQRVHFLKWNCKCHSCAKNPKRAKMQKSRQLLDNKVYVLPTKFNMWSQQRLSTWNQPITKIPSLLDIEVISLLFFTPIKLFPRHNFAKNIVFSF